jgi:hypothetical protein
MGNALVIASVERQPQQGNRAFYLPQHVRGTYESA